VRRELIAILAADVVGYSKLMGEDEARTLEALRRVRREIFNPAIHEHNGFLDKSMGDGWIVSFSSARDALQSAIQIQERLIDNQVVALRIGIHIGDVVYEDEDIYGDGINIAARLEALAEPGQVLISDSAYYSLDARQASIFDSGTATVLKNIKREVTVFRWGITPSVQASSDIETPAVSGRADLDLPSIVVLPLANQSNDEEQEYLVDGLTEDIIISLSALKWLRVCPRNSAFSFKGKGAGHDEIRNVLGVRYILEGSARKAGSRIRVTAQVSDITTNAQIWAERFDRSLSDLFELQDELTESISRCIPHEIMKNEQTRAKSRNYGSLDSWHLYQRGMWHFHQFWSPDDTRLAMEAFQRSLEMNPGLSYSYAALAELAFYDVIFGRVADPEGTLRQALRDATKAFQLDSDDAHTNFVLGIVQMLLGQLETSIFAFERAIGINQNSADAHHGLGWATLYSGDASSALEPLRKAIKLSPKDPRIFGYYLQLSIALLVLGEVEESHRQIQQALLYGNEDPWGHLMLAVTCHLMGDSDSSKAAFRVSQSLDSSLSVERAQSIYHVMDPGYRAQLLQYFELVGLPS
jgi:adenylate cyclase